MLAAFFDYLDGMVARFSRSTSRIGVELDSLADIVSFGVRYNNTYSQVLNQVLIDKSPGSQLVHQPFRPPKIPSPELAGSIRSTIRWRLTDNLNRAVDTNNETWSARIVIRYEIDDS